MTASHERVLRAGAAMVDITPALGSKIVGNFVEPLATHVHDPLHTRCLVLDDGTSRIAIAVCDNLGMVREMCDEARRLIADETGIASTNILISATHTHSGPSARYSAATSTAGPLDEYQKFVARRIADGVRCAVNNLEPARIGWGVASEPSQVFNRRWKIKPGTSLPNPFGGTDHVLMNPGIGNPNLLEPAGPTDPDVSFLSVQSHDGRPIALLANYSLHYVGGVPSGHISADYFAVFAERIKELWGADRVDPPFVAIMSNGTSGDINNINVLGTTEQLPPYTKMRRVADVVASDVFKVYKAIEHHDWVALRASEIELPLMYRKPTSEMIAYARNVLTKSKDDKRYHQLEDVYARRTLEMAELPETMRVRIQVFRIGEVAIAAIPFEVFAETGLEIKKRSPFKPTFTISLANGAGGYLPTIEQHRFGGYETWLGTNRVEVDAASKIVNAIREQFD